MKKEKNKYSAFNNIHFFYKKLYEFKPSVIWMMVASVVFGVAAPLYTIYFPKVLVDLVTGETSVQKFMLLFGGFLLTFVLFTFLYSMVIGRLSPLIILLLIVISLLNYSVFQWERKQWRKIQPKVDDLGKKINYISVSAGGDGGGDSTAKDLRIFGLNRWIHEKQDYLLGELKFYETKKKKWVIIRENIGHILGFLRDAVAYIYLITQTAKGVITAGDFVLYLGAIAGFSNFVNDIIGKVQEILAASDRAQNYREYLDKEDEKVEEGTVSAEDLKYPLEITFSHVSFGYEEDKEILSDLNFHIKAGEKIAIVGVNGAGKTTIVKLLCGFYEPTKGEIKINGINVREFAKKDLYKLFSTVFQDNRCFPFTVGENLTFQKQEEVDEDKAYKALEQAGILNKFKERNINLHDYMTHCFLQDGVEISGGEAQKIAIARALYKPAAFILFDEPTAALDPLAENEIYAGFDAIVGNKTAIYISHRLSSCKFCNDIVVFDKGRLVQRGSHDELLKDTAGKYYEMWNAQAKHYA